VILASLFAFLYVPITWRFDWSILQIKRRFDWLILVAAAWWAMMDPWVITPDERARHTQQFQSIMPDNG
jgi:hypothetical protein